MDGGDNADKSKWAWGRDEEDLFVVGQGWGPDRITVSFSSVDIGEQQQQRNLRPTTNIKGTS